MSLYPVVEQVADYRLKLDEQHTLYIEAFGNPQGIPVLFLHGGPGGGCTEQNRRYFDPMQYRVILFDQRGSGRSTPQGCTHHNTTAHLLEDIEKIRLYLGVEQWVLFAGSWGSTLALLYAQQHPLRVLAMVLRGSFLARQRDWLWFIQDGGPRFFPQVWSELLALLPAHSAQLSMTERLYRAVFSEDVSLSLSVSVLWQYWGRVMVNRSVEVARFEQAEWGACVQHAQIELHYAKHQYFLEENQILKHATKLPKVPTRLIHGQLDWVCPVESSFLLSQAIVQADLQVLKGVGHLTLEAGMQSALREGADWVLAELAAT